MPIANILTLEDLYKIQAILEEEGYGNIDLDISLNLRKPAFDKVNEEFYYMSNKEGTPPDVEKIEVKIGHVNFKYVLLEDEET